jgi:hypothetical protein
MLIVIVTSDAPDLRTTFTGLASRRRRMIRVDQT